MVVKDIGKDEEGKPIEVLFGALAMQQWGIRPVPDEERLDLARRRLHPQLARIAKSSHGVKPAAADNANLNRLDFSNRFL